MHLDWRAALLWSVVCFYMIDIETVAADDLFSQQVAPILSIKCFPCHNEVKSEGNFSLETRERFFAGGDSGEVVAVGSPDDSYLIELITGDAPVMPKNKPPLSASEQKLIRKWISAGASWPDEIRVTEPVVDDLNWWSLQPLHAPTLPAISDEDSIWARNEIDRFVVAKLRERGLSPSGEADRRTLIRRLYFDLTGLPPGYDAVNAFVHSPDPNAYEKVVDELLASPHYGERWARHWLDVAHYGDTHGYDKDQPRPNAWPYRDYVIRSFNDDKPYSRFVLEQVAGDALWPNTRDGIEATGFISAGPWDLIGHAEVPESKLDGKVARNLDRDDMVTSTMNTFVSMTVQCARCHNHKFDPVTQEHYYSLQAVFAALDRTDRTYDVDPTIAAQRRELNDKLAILKSRQTELAALVEKLGGEDLADIDRQIKEMGQIQSTGEYPAYGYHSEIAAAQDVRKWVQIELESPLQADKIVLRACRDNFAGIGEGFGFPVRFRIETAADANFTTDVRTVIDQTQTDFVNPKIQPVEFDLPASEPFRYLRITATKLAERSHDFIFALGELAIFDAEGVNVALNRPVSALDTIEMPPRWQKSNLVDGIFVSNESGETLKMKLADLQQQRQQILEHKLSAELRAQVSQVAAELNQVNETMAALPPPARVYGGAVHSGSGAFFGTGHQGGQPREIRVLGRGDIQSPGKLVNAGTVPIIPNTDWRFRLNENHSESDRRVALAQWLVRHDNPLTWRSIVNRIWLYHFGRGLVDSANDFGRMGELPTHPELLDWLATEFRDGPQSLKQLHRKIVTSSTYRQASLDRPEEIERDADNRFYWKMNRRLLDAESIRDATLQVSGKLNTQLYGPPFQDFVIERPEHSPHYEYHLHDPNDPVSHRRSIYRFIVRSQQQPFMQTLDCADPSESVAKRTTTLTSLQALTLMNNQFMIAMSKHLAQRAIEHSDDAVEQVRFMWRQALGRELNDGERDELVNLVKQFGLPYAARAILNLNEFVFVD